MHVSCAVLHLSVAIVSAHTLSVCIPGSTVNSGKTRSITAFRKKETRAWATIEGVIHIPNLDSVVERGTEQQMTPLG